MPADRPSVPTTPFPSRLLDAVMPTLRDTEWRLLCVIVRQTWGWQKQAGRTEAGAFEGQGGTGRKERDWLTHGQFKAKTGRSGEAVSHALDALVRRGLIEVMDEDGSPLATPQARRRHAGRLYFRLALNVLNEDKDFEVTSPSSTVPNERFSEYSASKSETSISVSEVKSLRIEKIAPKTETSVSESEVGKAKITKETEDKKEEWAATSSSASASPVEKPGDNRPAPTRTVPAHDRDTARFLRAYRDRFRGLSAQGDPPPLSWNRDGALVRRLLASYGYERLAELLAAFFASDDPWARRCGYSLAAFQHLLPRLLMGDGKQPARSENAPALVIHGPSAAWQRAAEVEKQGARASLFEQCPDLARRVRGQPP